MNIDYLEKFISLVALGVNKLELEVYKLKMLVFMLTSWNLALSILLIYTWSLL